MSTSSSTPAAATGEAAMQGGQFVSINGVREKKPRGRFEDPRAEAFFDFFSRHGIHFWELDALPRKLDGTRGARLASLIQTKRTKTNSKGIETVETIYPFKKKVGSDNILYQINNLQLWLRKNKRKYADLHVAESPRNKLYHRTIFIDDLTPVNLQRLLNWWTGSIMVMETSPDNFQALLIVADEYGINSKDKKAFATLLVENLNADNGSTSPTKLHRFAGSPNYKGCVGTNRDPFITTLHLARDAEPGGDLGSGCLRQLHERAYPKPQPKVAPELEVAARSKQLVPSAAMGATLTKPSGQSTGSTPSETDFLWALKEIKRGRSDDEITSGLLQRIKGRNHCPNDYPARTLFNARMVSIGSPERYSSGSPGRLAVVDSCLTHTSVSKRADH